MHHSGIPIIYMLRNRKTKRVDEEDEMTTEIAKQHLTTLLGNSSKSNPNGILIVFSFLILFHSDQRNIRPILWFYHISQFIGFYQARQSQ